MRAYNFSAGPAVLPDEVLRIAQQEFMDWQHTGSGVMEVSHRGEAFLALFRHIQDTLRGLMAIPEHYRILFLQGGARLQFSMLPLNLTKPDDEVDYVNSGHWSQLAIEAAQQQVTVREITSSATSQYTQIPNERTWQRNPHAAYLHFTSNETIHGLQFPTMPAAEDTVPLVCDMSSDFLSRPIDVSQFGIIYAGAQKNVGIAGLTIVIIREDLIAPPKRSGVPSLLQYTKQAHSDSLYNTPPTFAIYIAGLVFDWLKKQGGVLAMAQRNAEKAKLLYHAIDESNGFYIAPVDTAFRSQMNVVFRLADESLNDAFLKAAEAHQLRYLKGHTALGGMRASIYNAMTLEGVEALATFLHHFPQTL